MCTLTLINDDPLFLFGPIPVFPTTGMFVFWTLQTVCFALYSEHGDIKAAHTFIAMICKPPSISWYTGPWMLTWIASFRFWLWGWFTHWVVLFYAFCEHLFLDAQKSTTFRSWGRKIAALILDFSPYVDRWCTYHLVLYPSVETCKGHIGRWHLTSIS